jgi:hypothetical protein
VINANAIPSLCVFRLHWLLEFFWLANKLRQHHLICVFFTSLDISILLGILTLFYSFTLWRFRAFLLHTRVNLCQLLHIAIFYCFVVIVHVFLLQLFFLFLPYKLVSERVELHLLVNRVPQDLLIGVKF